MDINSIINKEYIELHAPDISSIKNANSLSNKNLFINHTRNIENDLYFAECSGSGKSTYKVSGDFIDLNNPIFRCNCPSRKLPCKHSIGLLFEILNKKEFVIGDIPEDILKKRQKQLDKKDKKNKLNQDLDTNIVKPPKKVNKTAKLKKMSKQLEGLEIAEKLISEIFTKGISNIANQSKSYYNQIAKELGNYYLLGIQALVYELIYNIEDIRNNNNKLNNIKAEFIYKDIFNTLIKLNSLLNKSRCYLETAIKEKNIDNINNELYELLGSIWKLEELNSMGLCKKHANILQLALYTNTSISQNVDIDIAYYIDVQTGQINPTYNYRPIKASNYIKQDEYMFNIIIPNILTYYNLKGDLNQRIRWEHFTTRELNKKDLKNIIDFALDINTAIQKAKHYLKTILSYNRYPVCISYSKLVYNKNQDLLILKDKKNNYISLSKDNIKNKNLLNLPQKYLYENQVLFGELICNNNNKNIIIKPLSIICDSQIIRL